MQINIPFNKISNLNELFSSLLASLEERKEIISMLNDIAPNDITVVYDSKNNEVRIDKTFQIPMDSLYAYEVGLDDYLREQGKEHEHHHSKEEEMQENSFPMDSLYAYEVGLDDYLREQAKEHEHHHSKEEEMQENSFPMDSLYAYEVGLDDYLREQAKEHEHHHRQKDIFLNQILSAIDSIDVDDIIKKEIEEIYSVFFSLQSEDGVVKELALEENRGNLIYLIGILNILNRLNIGNITLVGDVEKSDNDGNRAFKISKYLLEKIDNEDLCDDDFLFASLIDYITDDIKNKNEVDDDLKDECLIIK